MDLSREYALMCVKAVELQKFPTRIEAGDWIVDNEAEDVLSVGHCIWWSDSAVVGANDQAESVAYKLKVFTLSQLEKISCYHPSTFAARLLGTWEDEDFFFGARPDATQEKAALCMVMKRLHGKVWDGEDWRKPLMPRIKMGQA